MLSILHISAHDSWGGSGRSANRIHAGLKRAGLQSRMLVGRKATADADVNPICSDRLKKADRLSGRALGGVSLQYLFYPSSFALPWHEWFCGADIVQLYNTHGNYFSHTVLPFVSKRRPVVWRLSDMWPMTGHCAYSYDCERWKTGCGACPQLGGYPGLVHDTTAFLWRIKRSIYSRCRITIVAPSSWIAEMARASPLLGSFPLHLIPNGVDTDVFRPTPKRAARERLGIGGSKRVILFSAQFIGDHRKGGHLLEEALQRLAATDVGNLTILLVGEDGACKPLPIPFEVKGMASIKDDEVLALTYAAADMFVLPSLADNLPNALLESMASGTPCVTFNTGGCPEVVRHMETGYVADYGSAEDLMKGMKLILEQGGLRHRMARRCRELVLQEYTLELETSRFIRMYKAITESQVSGCAYEGGTRTRDTRRAAPA